MANSLENSAMSPPDGEVLDHLRRAGSLTVADLVTATGVTATAVRQRLTRLMADGIVDRQTERRERGRPNYRYSLTKKGHRQAGTNYADLALVLWEEVRSIANPEIRRGLLGRLVERLAAHYKNSIQGDTIEERLESVGQLLGERGVPVEVDVSGSLPVLTALACPYPDLAEQDRSICAMEKMLFAEVVGHGIQLSACRLDGAACCTFQAVES
jgi:predicted ArsR family transcriptional regulator